LRRGALFFLVIATGGIDPEIYRSVISGIARGCEEANCR
jgi:phosphoribosylaminoimidazole (AIR) synthetase